VNSYTITFFLNKFVKCWERVPDTSVLTAWWKSSDAWKPS